MDATETQTPNTTINDNNNRQTNSHSKQHRVSCAPELENFHQDIFDSRKTSKRGINFNSNTNSSSNTNEPFPCPASPILPKDIENLTKQVPAGGKGNQNQQQTQETQKSTSNNSNQTTDNNTIIDNQISIH